VLSALLTQSDNRQEKNDRVSQEPAMQATAKRILQ
jgi:hypothetical protein